ncbi:ATP-dependent metallopeptidase FtsH/Yme1/Tma family protein [Vibrio lentus]|nr:ATP-dependent metallopeptidase FtsH/Yme1/Tma family protein [Vibrio lentus]
MASYRCSAYVCIQSFGPGESNGRAVDYTTFVQEVGQGQIQDAQFNNSEISFCRRISTKYVTYMPVYDQKLLDDLISKT